MKMKTNSPIIALLMLFGWLVTAILSPVQFVPCQNLFPDENLDLLGFTKLPQEKSPAPSVKVLIVVSPADPKHSSKHSIPFDSPSPLSPDAGTALKTVLRC